MAEKQLKEITVVNPTPLHSNNTSIDPSSQPAQPTSSKRKKWLHSPWLWCILISAFIKLLIVALIIGLYHKNDNPRYHIEDVHIKISPNLYPEYDITIEAKNKNHLSTIVFDKDGNASLFSGQNEIARGKYQQFKEHPGSSHNVTMILHGSTVLPKIEPDMKFADIRGHIPLFLSIDVPMKVEIWELKVKRKNIKVKCSFSLDKLDKDSKLLGGNCDSEG